MDRMSKDWYWIKWKQEGSSFSRTEVMREDRPRVSEVDRPDRKDFCYWDWKSEIKV